MQLWGEYGVFIEQILERQVRRYENDLHRRDTEWETLQQDIEYTAKRQALKELRETLSKHYE